ncbi:MAG TPA: protease pro-enzyme activation domain-containing protein [Vicinamibacterales bacterium]|jgi:hypothetical protein|nr:protease pro-enzyme activation domain-containing protein [Vicinamibacterales bacterium]
MKRTLGAVCLAAIAAMMLATAGVRGQGPIGNTPVPLRGNTRPEAIPANDRGLVPDGLAMEHMLLQLQRPAALDQQLVSLIDDMNRPGSAVYHQWLTAAQFGQRFGLPQADLTRITTWLTSQGFRIDNVASSGMLIEFSGNAGQVRRAFGAEIHALSVNGDAHIANMSDPQIPAALAGLVKGIVSLHDFRPGTHLHKRAEFQVVIGGNTFEAVSPADLATIYNLNPVFAAGINGAGQTIVVIEDTLLANVSDVATFRAAFGLTGGSFSQKLATGGITCNNSGVNADEGEAALDAEWAGASAPGASVVLASCADTVTVFGGLIAFQNLINGPAPPPIVSISYGECESANGAAANASYVSAYQQAAAEGVSVFVSSGDEGAASCDANKTVATHGVAVSGFASTPYNVAVGGTDFGDTYLSVFGSPALPVSTYWNATNTPVFESAKSYIPEIPWNNSCASQLLHTFEGYAIAYGPSGFCNSTTGKNFRTTASGSGGPSAFSSQPSWQTGLTGLPTSSGGPRYLPDVSLFAANGVWNHFFVYCLTDTAEGGVPCNYNNATDVDDLAAGGTSFASPIMAGIQALINQHVGGVAQGNPNPRLYAMAAAEYGPSGSAACNSSLGASVGSSCFFYDVTQGDIDLNCTGASNCYGTSKVGATIYQGVLSVTSGTLDPAYDTNTGWDFATGIGTLNAYNLVFGWAPASTTTTIMSGLTPSPSGAPVTFTATVVSQNHQAVTGSVTWSANTGCGTTQVTAGISGVATCTTSALGAGTDAVAASYSGDVTHLVSSGVVSQLVQPTSNGGVSLSAASVTFPGRQLAGTTSPASQVIQVTSTGSGPLVFTAFNGSAPSASFAVGGGDFQAQTTCPLTLPGLAPGNMCTFTFKFSPTSAGNRATTLQLSDNAPGSTQTIELNGTAFVVDNPTVTQAVGAGASELVSIQNADGGWPFVVGSTNCGYGAGVSCPNTVGVTALGLLAGYTRNNSPADLTAATAAGNDLVALFNAAMQQTPHGLPHDQDVEFLIALGQLTGNATYTNTATSWFNAVVAQYPDAAAWVDDTFALRDAEGIRTVGAWDSASFIRAAVAVGNVTYATAAANRVIAREADWKDTNPAHRYDQCPSQACGPADNPYAFDYTLPSEGSLLWAFSDLPGFNAKISEYRTFLIAQQDPAGSWDVGDSQITAYVVVGLAAVGGADTAMTSAAAFYIANQLPTGGWPSYVGAALGAENAEVDAEINRALQTLFSTQAGSNITVLPAQLSALTFASVSAPGLTSVVAVDSSAAQSAAPGFSVVNGLAYDVVTTAGVSGRITACFTVPWVTDARAFARLRVLHLENGVMVDRTAASPAPDFASRRLCALTTSLSPFAIAQALPDTTPPSITVVLTPAVLRAEGDEAITVHATIRVHDDRDPAPKVELVSITSNEPIKTGDIEDAALGTDDRVFRLRVDSRERGRQRTYAAVYRATDASGNATDVTTTIAVERRREERR